jgi:DNA-binding MarR family transcriptional regulator
VDGPVPTGAELAVWRDFLRAHATIAHRLEAELMAEQELPLAWYDVLLQLSEAPGRRLRMTELADRVLLSRSGLTRLVDRLVRDGLVRREPCEDDARGTYSVLTDEGRRRLRVAAPTHLRGIRDHMTRHFAPGELEQLGALLRSLLDAVERSGDHVHGTPQPRRAGD